MKEIYSWKLIKFYKIILLFLVWNMICQNSFAAGQNLDATYAKAYGLYTRGDLVSAQQIFENNIVSYPYFGPFYDGLGDVLLKKGDFSKAYDSYKKAVEKDPFNNIYKAHMYGAIYASTQFKIQKAKDDFLNAAFLAPQNVIILTNISDCFDQNYKNLRYMTDFYTDVDGNLTKGNKARVEGQKELALKYYLISTNKKSVKYKAYNNIALVYFDNNDASNTLVYLNKALKESPKSPYINNNLGVLMFKKGDYAKAESYFNEALKNYNSYSSVYNNLAVNKIAKALHDSLKNIPAISLLSDNDATNLALRKLLAKLYVLGGNYSKATDLYSLVDSTNDYNYEFLCDYGFYLFKNGKFKEAENTINKAILLYPYDMKNTLLLARIQENTYKAGNAVDNYEKVLAKAPNLYDVYYYYGSFLSQLGREEESRKFMKKYVDLAQDNPNSYVVKNMIENGAKF